LINGRFAIKNKCNTTYVFAACIIKILFSVLIPQIKVKNFQKQSVKLRLTPNFRKSNFNKIRTTFPVFSISRQGFGMSLFRGKRLGIIPSPRPYAWCFAYSGGGGKSNG